VDQRQAIFAGGTGEQAKLPDDRDEFVIADVFDADSLTPLFAHRKIGMC
jgi:hypothetical protein